MRLLNVGIDLLSNPITPVIEFRVGKGFTCDM